MHTAPDSIELEFQHDLSFIMEEMVEELSSTNKQSSPLEAPHAYFDSEDLLQWPSLGWLIVVNAILFLWLSYLFLLLFLLLCCRVLCCIRAYRIVFVQILKKKLCNNFFSILVTNH